VTDRAAADLLSADHLAVIVDSPPGAGKSTFVGSTAATLTNQQDQVPIVAQTNAQADDLVRLPESIPDTASLRAQHERATPSPTIRRRWSSSVALRNRAMRTRRLPTATLIA
jgi:predicted PilT family ATPase